MSVHASLLHVIQAAGGFLTCYLSRLLSLLKHRWSLWSVISENKRTQKNYFCPNWPNWKRMDQKKQIFLQISPSPYYWSSVFTRIKVTWVSYWCSDSDLVLLSEIFVTTFQGILMLPVQRQMLNSDTTSWVGKNALRVYTNRCIWNLYLNVV